ncbi:hypothetical protein [Pseudofulvibacter geojedonensis]|uniref:Uncharacterized protein n=1 Tax=Pseudofulvibacter geojedonensis TaxID=1123758 RepID=A0ABW3I0B5_9FLAO
MDRLKLKIFEALSLKITMLEFEKWLYKQENLMCLIDSNDFIFELVTINYKNPNSYNYLKNLANENYLEEECILFLLEKTCLDIINVKTSDKICDKSMEVVKKYTYDCGYELLWEIYLLYTQHNLVEIGYMRAKEFNLGFKKEAQKIIQNLNKCVSLEAKIQLLKNGFL